MNIGYARVSTEDQNLDLQLQALHEAGCGRIYTDTASGALSARKGLARAIRHCRAGDTLIVWKLDRLGRSLIDLVQTAQTLKDRDVGMRVLTGQGAMIDTTHSEGRMIFGLFAVLAEFERELIRERTIAGMRAARKRGVAIGRPPKLTPAQIERARRAVLSKTATLKATAAALGVHPVTLRRAIQSRG